MIPPTRHGATGLAGAILRRDLGVGKAMTKLDGSCFINRLPSKFSARVDAVLSRMIRPVAVAA